MKKQNKNINKIFWGFTITVYIYIILSFLIRKDPSVGIGHISDGILYSIISNNLAHGIGTIWHPVFTKVWFNPFYEHPPLMLGIESLFYRVLGDSIYIDRLIVFLTSFLSIVAIVKIWNLIFEEKKAKMFSWIPILLWITSSIAYRTCRINKMENFVCFISIFAIYFVLKGVKRSQNFNFIIAGFLVFVGFLCNGPMALFPLSAAFIYYLVFDRRVNLKKIFEIFMPVISFFIFIFLLLSFSSGARINLYHYFNQQVLASTIGGRVNLTLFERCHLFQELYHAITLMIIAVIVCFVFGIKKLKTKKNKKIKESIFFLLIGFSASFPIMLSGRFLTTYIMPSIVYFALGFGVIIHFFIKDIFENINLKIYKILKIVAILLFVCSIMFFIYSIKHSKERGPFKYADKISTIVPHKTEISVLCGEMPEKYELFYWGFTDYLIRLYKIETIKINKNEIQKINTNYLIAFQGSPQIKLKNYKLIYTQPNEFKIYQKIKNSLKIKREI